MKVTESLVRKITISEAEHLDPIHATLEDEGPGRGRITIDCFGDAWSGTWGALAETKEPKQ